MNMVVVINVQYDEDNRNLNVELSGDEMGVLIGKRGQTLDISTYSIIFTPYLLFFSLYCFTMFALAARLPGFAFLL